jgi:hypothetical protein
LAGANVEETRHGSSLTCYVISHCYEGNQFAAQMSWYEMAISTAVLGGDVPRAHI